jgi:hypothetical protein
MGSINALVHTNRWRENSCFLNIRLHIPRIPFIKIRFQPLSGPINDEILKAQSIQLFKIIPRVIFPLLIDTQTQSSLIVKNCKPSKQAT